MKLPTHQLANPITGVIEPAWQCKYCDGVFVGFQMNANRYLCKKCYNAAHKRQPAYAKTVGAFRNIYRIKK